MSKQEPPVALGVRLGADTGSLQRRRLKNYLVKTKFQLKYSYYMILAGFAFFGTTVFLVREKLTEVDVLLRDNQIVDALVRNQIHEAYSDITQITLAGFALYVMFTTIYALLLTHRVSGPMISIVTFIDELKKGNYGYARNLRSGDELGPVMKGLHELAQVLANLGKQSDPSRPQ